MKYCSKCGKTYEDGQKFCAICGTSVESALDSAPTLAQADRLPAKQGDAKSMARILMSTVNIVSLVLMLTFCSRMLFRGIINSTSFDLLAPFAVPDILAYLAIAISLFGSVFAVVFSRLNHRQPTLFYSKVLMWMLVIAFIGEAFYISCEIAVYAIKVGEGMNSAGFNFIIMLSAFVLTAIAVCAVSAFFSNKFGKTEEVKPSSKETSQNSNETNT